MTQLTDIKCTNCGAELQVDRRMTEGNCQFCGSKLNFKLCLPSISSKDLHSRQSFDNFLSLATSFLETDELESADHYATKALELNATSPAAWQCRMETPLSIAKKIPLGEGLLDRIKSGFSAAETAIKFQANEPSIKLILLKYCTYLLENLNKELDQAILRHNPDIYSTTQPYWDASACYNQIFNDLFLQIEDYYVDDKDIFEYILVIRKKGQDVVDKLKICDSKFFGDEWGINKSYQWFLERIDKLIITPHTQKYGEHETPDIPFNIPLDIWKGMTEEERLALTQCASESPGLHEEINSEDAPPNKDTEKSAYKTNPSIDSKGILIASSGIVFLIVSYIIDLISPEILASKHIVVYFGIHHALDTIVCLIDSLSRERNGLWGWAYFLMKPVYFARRPNSNYALKYLSIISMICTCWYFFAHAITN